jgi:hypothetical protein
MLLLAKRENRGFHVATDWYLKGWKPTGYQWLWHHWNIMNTTFVAGIATGKTTIVAASSLIDCISQPYYYALNTSVTAKQAELAFDMVMGWVEGNPKLEHLIHDISHRPFRSITFQNYARYDFRTAGKNARFIRGSEYDRINYDEAGLDFYGDAIGVLRGRLRGTRPDGFNTPRAARLDVTTSPTDAPWLRERFDKGWKRAPEFDPRLYRSLRVATWDNPFLTKMQVEAMKAEYPPNLLDVEMGGHFPDYGFSMFPQSHVNACVDQGLYDAAFSALYPQEADPDSTALPKKGYKLDEDPRHGIIFFELPPEPGRVYIAAGDPGAGEYPKRNAPCVAVADITEKPFRLVYFDWGSGRGSYNPFLRSYKYAIDRYTPVLKGIDATGPQKGIDELAFENQGISTDKINFTTDKNAILNSLVMDITNHNWAYPPIKGLQKQLSSYTLEGDKKKDPQDIVMTLGELSYLQRFLPPLSEVPQGPMPQVIRSRRQRTTHTSRRKRTR